IAGNSRLQSGPMALFLILSALTLFGSQALGQTSKLNQMQSRDFVNKGNAFMARRQFQDALDEYQKAIDLDPSNAAARNNILLTHLNWGAVHFAQNKFDDAMQEWETVLKLDPYNQNAKHNINVLKQAVARRGGPAPAKPPAAAQEKPKEEKKPGSSVVILSPGFKQSEGTTTFSSGSTDDSAGGSSTTTETPAAAPAETAAPPDTSAQQPGTPATPDLPPAAGGSLEDQLSAIELKIYGHKQVDMTVLKRLEKMEMDTAGQVRAGTIKERIDLLKKSYGL